MTTIKSIISSDNQEVIRQLLIGFLEGNNSLKFVLETLEPFIQINFNFSPNERFVLQNDLDGLIKIPVEKKYLENMLDRYLNDLVTENELSNWAAFIFMTDLFIPKGETEDDRWEEGNSSAWDILQQLMTPSVFGGLSKDSIIYYIDLLKQNREK